MKITPIATFLVTLPLLGCVTDNLNPVVDERQAEQKTEAAYDRADEKILKAQNNADEQSIKASNEADAKIIKAHDDADRVSEAAYKEAEQTEINANRDVKTLRQRQFVEAMNKRLDQRRSGIRDLEAAAHKKTAEARTRFLPGINTAKDAAKAASKELTNIETASWDTWETSVAQVEKAFGKLDDRYLEAKKRL